MKALYLLRHSLTEANERRLYGGSTDSPLTERGRALARERFGHLPECDVYIASGMLRAVETLRLMTGHEADITLTDLREMDFGVFEMRGYEALKDDPAYLAWIGDDSGQVRCPGGESSADFRKRVVEGGQALLAIEKNTALVVCHGGVIVNLMQAWFPTVPRNFYEWQPSACQGYRVGIENGRPTGFESI